MRIKENKDILFLVRNGFFHIFSANVINKIIQFGISVVIVRVITKEAFGMWSYANNILSFFLLIEGLGVVPGLLQFASAAKDKEEKLSYLKYALLVGSLFNTILAIAIFLFTIFFELPIRGSTEILRYLSFLPLITILFNTLQVFLRSDLRNKQFSLVTVINTLAFFFGVLIGGYFFEIAGIIWGRYLSYFISCFIAAWFVKDYYESFLKAKLPSSSNRQEFLKFSIVSMLTNSISSILYLLDTFLIGIFIQSETVVASYKTATLIPFALNFIPASVMTFAYPYFAKNKDNKEVVKKYFLKMQRYLFLLNLVISVLLITFAPFIIKVVFGEEYLDSLMPFRILSLGYLIAATFRIPAGNVIASLRKVKVNFYNSIVSGSANVVLDIILIKRYGSNGAAIATVLIFIISSIISNIYLRKYLK
ncbi:MAG: flippase [Candidatus Caldatribacteriota bacterium]|jgi:O-antigen/teichoic acid export membrane protein